MKNTAGKKEGGSVDLLIKLFWLTSGLGSLTISVIGFLLPIIPGFPFFFLAAYCFGRLSPKFENYLKTRLWWQKVELLKNKLKRHPKGSNLKC